MQLELIVVVGFHKHTRAVWGYDRFDGVCLAVDRALNQHVLRLSLYSNPRIGLHPIASEDDLGVESPAKLWHCLAMEVRASTVGRPVRVVGD